MYLVKWRNEKRNEKFQVFTLNILDTIYARQTGRQCHINKVICKQKWIESKKQTKLKDVNAEICASNINTQLKIILKLIFWRKV